MFKSFFRPVTKVVVKLDKLGDIAEGLKNLADKQVLVGIPAEKAARSGNKGGPDNAQRAYILSNGVRTGEMRQAMKADMDTGKSYGQAMDAWNIAHGDPLWHIPPRPFLEPALDGGKEKLAAQQKKIIQAAMDGNLIKSAAELQALGMLGQNLVKAWFTDPRNNWPENAPVTIARKGSEKPNIDSGQMRNAITYVIRSHKSDF